MRRAVVIACFAIAILGVATAAIVRSGQEHDSDYRVDIIFDNGKGVLVGGLVKVAGATVGGIEDVTVTPDRKAKVRIRLDKRFGPFHRDAHCSNRLEGLIGAAVINCEPGTPGTPLLARQRDGTPLMPVERTTIPVSLTDFFEIWKIPVRDRLRVLVNELGITLSARGDDVNHLLRRANPALQKAQRALAIIDAQRHTLAQAITDSNRAIGRAAHDRQAVRGLIREGGRTSELLGARDRDIAESIQRLPPLLSNSNAALTELDALSRATSPSLDNLNSAARPLDRLTRDAVPFAQLALPAVNATTPALKQAQRTIKPLKPVVRSLGRLAKAAGPTSRVTSSLFTNLRDRGAFEGLLQVFYYATASVARYDNISHVEPSHQLVDTCANYATTPSADCEIHFVPQGVRDAGKTKRAPQAKTSESPAAAKPQPALPQPATPKPSPTKPLTDKLPKLPVPPPVQQTVDDLLDFLLG